MVILKSNKVAYLGCILDNNLSGESIATKVLSLVNNRLKFLYRKQKFLREQSLSTGERGVEGK